MGWTEPVDASRYQHLLRLWQAAKSYILFDTRRLVHLSDWSFPSERFSLTSGLFFAAAALTTYASSLFLPNGSGPLGFVDWSARAILIFVALLALPAFVAFRLLKIKRIHFVVNLLVIQQFFLALTVIASYQVLVSQEPARTDFTMLRDGSGQRTVAFDYYCGDLAISAEMPMLNQRAQARAESVLKDIKVIGSWGPPTPESATFRMPELLAQFRRRQAEFVEMKSDLVRVKALQAQREQNATRFVSTYPTYLLAADLFLGLATLAGLWTSWHMARAAALGDREKRALPTAAFGILFGWGLVVGFGWAAGLAAGFPLYSPVDSPEFSVSRDGRRRMPVREEILAYNAEAVRLDEEQRSINADLRSEIYKMRNICPNVKDHPLLVNALGRP